MTRNILNSCVQTSQGELKTQFIVALYYFESKHSGILLSIRFVLPISPSDIPTSNNLMKSFLQADPNNIFLWEAYAFV